MATQPYRIERWADAASDTLNGAVLASDTTITLNSVAEFPTSGDFRIRLVDGGTSEYATVKSVSGSVFTLTAGLTNGYSDSSEVTHYLNADSLDEAFKQAYGETEYPYNRIMSEGVTKADADFTWISAPGSFSSADADDGGINLTIDSASGATIRGKHITAPSTPWTITAYIEFGPGAANWDGANGTFMGIYARESSTGKLYFLTVRSDVYALWRMTDPATFSADVDTFLENERFSAWIRLMDDGTDIRGFVSSDGNDWLEAWNEGRTSFMTTGANQIGFGAAVDNGADDTMFHFKTWIVD